MSSIDELKKLHDLKESGAISESEYLKLKEAIISGENSFSKKLNDLKENDWAMLLHLSQLLGFVVPGFGFIVPVFIWLTKKDESEVMDEHGRNVVNWIISQFIYFAVSIALMFVFIGIPLVFLLTIVGIIFPILGALKAREGVFWKYPTSIEFIKKSNSL